jgi:hypothetical protein
MGATKRDCPLCGEPLEDNPADHDVAKCEKAELLKGRTEIKKLKQSLSEWKDAWFQLREIIGELWWHHPAIDNDEKRTYYQHVLLELREKQPKPNDVYVEGKLVGSGTSPDAANAIRRLMQLT